MPIYAYRCTECGHEFDVLQKVSDAPLTECPACQRSALIKKVTAAGFQLKGSGWYVTDFRDKGSGKKPAANGESTPSGEAAKTSGQTADSGTKDTAATKDSAPAKSPTPPAPASND